MLELEKLDASVFKQLSAVAKARLIAHLYENGIQGLRDGELASLARLVK
jgi:hypothetical protein